MTILWEKHSVFPGANAKLCCGLLLGVLIKHNIPGRIIGHGYRPHMGLVANQDLFLPR